MSHSDDPPFLTVGTEVSAKYRGAFCEATIKVAKKLVKCKVSYSKGQTAMVSNEVIKGPLKVSVQVEVRQPDGQYQAATILKLTDQSTYTVVFDDGDERTLKRSSLCLKGARHFHESETLDHLPLTDPENFGTPVMQSSKKCGRKRRRLSGYGSSADEELSRKKMCYPPEFPVGKVVFHENDRRRSGWLPAVIVPAHYVLEESEMSPDTICIRSFKDGRFFAATKNDLHDFSPDREPLQSMLEGEVQAMYVHKPAIERAMAYLDTGELPWNMDLFDKMDSQSDHTPEKGQAEEEEEEEESDTETEAFMEKLKKFHESKGTPFSRQPTLAQKDLNLWKLYCLVADNGGFEKVCQEMKWRSLYLQLGMPPTANASYTIKQAYKKYLLMYEQQQKSKLKVKESPGRNTRRRTAVLEKESDEEHDKPEKKEKPEKQEKISRPEKQSKNERQEKQNDKQEKPTEKHSKQDRQPRQEKATRWTKQREAKELRDSREAKETKDSKDSRDMKDSNDTKDVKDCRNRRDTKDSNDTKESKDAKDSRDARGAKDPKEGKDSREEKVTKGSLKEEKVARGSLKEEKVARGSLKEEKVARGSLKEEKVAKGSLKEEKVARGSLKEEKVARGSLKEVAEEVCANEKAGSAHEGKPDSSDLESSQTESISNNSDEAEEVSCPPKLVGVEQSPHGYLENDRILVWYGRGKTLRPYEAKILGVEESKLKRDYLVHYNGWNTRYDEWIEEERIAGRATSPNKAGNRPLFSKKKLMAKKVKPNGLDTPRIKREKRPPSSTLSSSSTSITSSASTKPSPPPENAVNTPAPGGNGAGVTGGNGGKVQTRGPGRPTKRRRTVSATNDSTGSESSFSPRSLPPVPESLEINKIAPKAEPLSPQPQTSQPRPQSLLPLSPPECQTAQEPLRTARPVENSELKRETEVDEEIEVKREENLNWASPRHTSDALLCSERLPGARELKTMAEESEDLVASATPEPNRSPSPSPVREDPIMDDSSSLSPLSPPKQPPLVLAESSERFSPPPSPPNMLSNLQQLAHAAEKTKEREENGDDKMEIDDDSTKTSEKSPPSSEKADSPMSSLDSRSRSKGSPPENGKRRVRVWESDEAYEARKIARRANMNYLINFDKLPQLSNMERIQLLQERLRGVQRKWGELKAEVAYLDRKRRRARRKEREAARNQAAQAGHHLHRQSPAIECH